LPDPAKSPDDPLAFIQDCVRARRIYWTYHVSMRLLARRIGREEILAAVDGYEVIESYPDDKYLPNYLVLARMAADAFHVLFAADVDGPNVRIVTAYRPDPGVWTADLRKRNAP
jgi:Domain of unknown function (DUF4258)